MEQRKSQGQLLDELVSSGKISREESDDVRFAPKWSVSVRELVTYLGALIVAVGLLRLVAFAFEDASKWTIMSAAYVLAVALAAGAWKLSRHSGVRGRLSEVLELGALLAALLGSIVPLDATNLRPQGTAMILTAIATGWGVMRLSNSTFAGTAAVSVGLPGFAIALGSLIDDNSPRYFAALFVVAGSMLIWLAIKKLGLASLESAVGSLCIVIGSITLGASFSGNSPWFPIITGAALFAVGATRIAPENLVAGALCVIVGIIMTVDKFIDSELVQSLVVIASGVAVLLVLGAQMRRRPSKSEPGALAA
jgi:hypothetical protein